MYTHENFRTKKALKQAVADWNEFKENEDLWRLNHQFPAKAGDVLAGSMKYPPNPVTYYQPGPFGGEEPQDGQFCVEGPHYPQPHRWYATCTSKNSVIVKVK